MDPRLDQMFAALETASRVLLAHVAQQTDLTPEAAREIHARMLRLARLWQSTYQLLALALPPGEAPPPQLVGGGSFTS